MTKIAMAFVAVVLVSACGGSSHSFNPAGTWTLTDKIQHGSCPTPAPETVAIVQSGNTFALQGYSMASAFCGETSCELQGTGPNGARDLLFSADGVGGNLSQAGCFFSTSGSK